MIRTNGIVKVSLLYNKINKSIPVKVYLSKDIE